MTATDRLRTGMTYKQEMRVTYQDTAAVWNSGLLAVLSTPRLVALMEEAALLLVQPYLPEALTTVGTRVDMAHVAATPIGFTAWAEATLTKIDRRALTFDVVAFNDAGEIGRGTHERFIVEKEKFMAKLEAKQS